MCSISASRASVSGSSTSTMVVVDGDAISAALVDVFSTSILIPPAGVGGGLSSHLGFSGFERSNERSIFKDGVKSALRTTDQMLVCASIGSMAYRVEHTCARR
jgi:hypothetical protein